MKVIQVLRLKYVQTVSVGLGTFKQMADHVDRKIVVEQDQMMSSVPRPSGEDVYPCNVLFVLLSDIRRTQQESKPSKLL